MERENGNYSILSDRRILEHISGGNVVIEPLVKENINTSSVDVTLGQFYYRQQYPIHGHEIYSPWSRDDVERIWGAPKTADVAELYFDQIGVRIPQGISRDDKIIMIGPHETILAHTNEFIGGRNGITTMMKARSSMGRNFIEVCKCAGWGDVGYINRWTMEITNNSASYRIPLVVDRRIAQIIFAEVGPILSEDYAREGKYQTTDDIKEVMQNWQPNDMLPKMWMDKEVAKDL